MSKKILTAIIIVVLIIIITCVYFYFKGNNNPAVLADNGASNNNQPVNQEKMIQGMKVEVLKEGTGVAQAKFGDSITVNYAGMLENGTKFGSSIDSGEPLPFILGVGQVIKGWDLGIEGMKIGEKRKLTIPSSLGYGERGAGKVIPPNATLIFEIELLEIK